MHTLPLPSVLYCVVRILPTIALLIALSAGTFAQTLTPFIGKPGTNLGEGVLPERFALVVGINRYDTTSTLGLNDLNNAENDAEGIASELSEAGFTSFVLTTGRKIKATPNEPPYVTKNEILNKLSTLINYASKSRERTGRPPIILFYFAGHGLNVDGNDYILPSNFKPSFAEDVPVMGISISEIANRISWADPALKIIISDACRTRSPGTLVKRSTPGDIAALQPGHKNTRLIETARARGINDTILAFATLGDHAAADSGEKGTHGKFAGSFIEVLRRAREQARTAGAGGHVSTANEILQRTKKAMELDTTSVQGSEYLERATSFVFHPTQKDFELEELVWSRARKYTVTEADEEAIRKAFYCNFKQFILQTSYYSYFGAAALDRLRRYEGGAIECENTELKITASESNEVKFFKPLQGGWVVKVPESGRPPDVARSPDRRSRVEGMFRVAVHGTLDRLAFTEPQVRLQGRVAAKSIVLHHSPAEEDSLNLASPAAAEIFAQSAPKDEAKTAEDLKIKHLSSLGLDPQAIAEVVRFDPEARVDDLAVASADLTLYEDAKLTRAVAEIKAGDLLQVMRILGPNVINVRTSQHPAGTPPKDLGQVGFVRQRPVDSGRIAVKFPVKVHLPGAIRYDNSLVDPILRSSIVTDMQVRFPSKDKLVGYARAQIAADRFGASATPVDQKIRRFVPSLLPSSAKEDELDDSVWVVTTLLPLLRNDRLRFLSTSGVSVRPEDAVNLVSFAERTIPVAGGGSDVLSDDCFAAAQEIRQLMNSRVTAFVQFAPDAQRSQSENIRTILKAGGFYPPAAEKVSVAPPPTNEVRVCADQNKRAAIAARDLLDKCKVGVFASRQIPACRKKFPRDTIEIWLGVANSPG